MNQTEGKTSPSARRVTLSLLLLFVLIALVSPNSRAESCGLLRSRGGMGHPQEGPCVIRPTPPPPAMIDRGMGHPPFFGDANELGLDEKQRQIIREIKSRVMKDALRKNAEIMVVRIELSDMTQKTPLDMNAIEAKLRQIGALDVGIQLSHLKAMAEIESKLTPEQRKRLRSMREQPPWQPPWIKRMHACGDLNRPDVRPLEPKLQNGHRHAEPTEAE
jgi:Spy/CpxP family protein refolding chaperone